MLQLISVSCLPKPQAAQLQAQHQALAHAHMAAANGPVMVMTPGLAAYAGGPMLLPHGTPMYNTGQGMVFIDPSQAAYANAIPAGAIAMAPYPTYMHAGPGMAINAGYGFYPAASPMAGASGYMPNAAEMTAVAAAAAAQEAEEQAKAQAVAAANAVMQQ